MSSSNSQQGLQPAVLMATGLALVVLLAWFPALDNGFVWDDHPLIVDNDDLVRPGAVLRAFSDHFFAAEGRDAGTYYRPLVTLTYVVGRQLHDLRPFPFHLTNVGLHVAAAVLVFMLLLDLGLARWPALLGAALFGGHPVLAESVAWVSGRTDPLATVWILLFLIGDWRRRRPLWRGLSLLALAAALLSKETAVMAPIAAVLAAWLRGDRLATALRARLDAAAVVVAYLGLRVAVIGASATVDAALGERLPWTTRLAGIPHLVGILVAPAGSRVEYGYGLPPGPLIFGAVAGGLLLAAFAWGILREAGSEEPPVLRVLVLCGLLFLLPAAFAVLTKAVLADRLIYLPAAFLAPACMVLLARLLPRRVALATGAAAVGVFLLMSPARANLWQSERIYFEAAAAESHTSARAWLNLGVAYRVESRLADSLDALQASVDAAPRKTAHYNLALLHSLIGCDDLAIVHYRAALAEDVGFVAAANNLGRLLAQRGRFEEAIEVLTSGLRNGRGDTAEIAAALELARQQQGTAPPEELTACAPNIESLRRALRDADALSAMAVRALKRRELERARAFVDAALRIDPAHVDARLNLAQWHLFRDQRQEARSVLQDVLTERPGHPDALRLMQYVDSR